MNLRSKKEMVARLLDIGLGRVWFNPEKSNEIKEAVTKEDLRGLISNGVILVKPKRGISRSRIRKRIIQKRKGRRNGPGNKKGKETARLSRKQNWMNSIRAQRDLVSSLVTDQKISRETYRHLRVKSRGGFFRSRRHIKLYLTEHELWLKKDKK
ncbi:50S ribosomal protein L19e [Candidatus Woesearchaeota archaeon]|nr:50S ribosomal protein L19e [Candidatus Woesearchaeota archaeon]